MLINWEKSGRMKTSAVEEEVWTEEMEEEDFFRWISDNNKVALRRYKAGNIRGVFKILDRYKAMQKYAAKDPLLSLLETGTANLLTILATKQVDDLYFGRGIELYQTAVDIFEEKAARYRQRREAPRPDSLNWAKIIGGLSDLKWKGPDEYRDAVLTVHQTVYRYYKTEATLRRNLILRPQSKEHKRNILMLMANTAMQVLRLAMRHAPHRVDEIHNRVDQYHGKYFYDETLPFVWGLAITEHFLDKNHDLDRLEGLYDRFAAGYDVLLGETDNKAFRDSSHNESRFISRSAKHRLVLLEG